MQKVQPELLDLETIIKKKIPGIYKRTPKFILSYLKRKIHQEELNEILTIYADKEGVDFMEGAINYFNLDLQTEGLEKLNKNGRYIFASNHPLGGLDGICLTAVIGKKFNKKIKYPVNDLLLNIRNLHSIFVPINKYGTQSKNAAKLMNEAFSSDNQIITFPAGLCSRKIKGEICDLEWKKTFILKAVENKRDIIPVYFAAANSKFFYNFANIRKRLGIKFNFELIYLPDEMFKNKNKTFTIIFGEPISYKLFDKSKTAGEWAEYVKEKAYSLRRTGK